MKHGVSARRWFEGGGGGVVPRGDKEVVPQNTNSPCRNRRQIELHQAPVIPDMGHEIGPTQPCSSRVRATLSVCPVQSSPVVLSLEQEKNVVP